MVFIHRLFGHIKIVDTKKSIEAKLENIGILFGREKVINSNLIDSSLFTPIYLVQYMVLNIL